MKYKITLLFTSLIFSLTAVAQTSVTKVETPLILLSAKQVKVSAVKQTVAFSVTSNVDYTVTSGADWVSVRRYNNRIVLTVSENTLAEMRTATVSIRSADAALNKQLKVVQSAKEHAVSYLFPCTATMEDPYGVCSHITRSTWDYPYRASNLQKMQEAGITNVRSDLDWWGVYSSAKSTWNDTLFDKTLLTVQRFNNTLLPILDQRFKGVMAWENLDSYLTYVDHLSNRYKGRFPVWELMNEPDYNFGNNDSIGHLYAKYMAAVAPVLRKNNPNAKLAFAGIVGTAVVPGANPSKLVETVFKEVGGDYFDIMNIHTYATPEETIDALQNVHNLMQTYNISKPLWITECGYSTPYVDQHDSLFFTEAVPEALERIHLKASQVRLAVINDKTGGVQFDDELAGCLGAFKDVKNIKLDDLATLSPKKYPVLLACSGEFFPKAYEDDLVQYVKAGGTIILPSGSPFAYNSYSGSTQQASDGSILTKLHMQVINPWNSGLSAHPTSCRKADGWNFNYSYTYPYYFTWENAFYLSDANLKTGDQFIPMIYAGDGNTTGTVAALYNLNSDLKGNVIVQTRQTWFYKLTEYRQAIRLPRIFLISFSYGVDKVFWYNLRSFENDMNEREDHFGILHKDLSNKTAFHAYRTLTTMCPSGSTRPKLEKNDNLYTVRWQRSDGKQVAAIWSIGGGYLHAVPLAQNVEVFNFLGEKLSTDDGQYNVSAAPIYFVSDDSIDSFSFN